MDTEWYFQVNDQWCGPFSGAQIKELAASGRLRSGSLVGRGADGSAIPAEQVKGLFKNGAVKESPTPPPPALPDSQGRNKAAGTTTSKTSTRLGNLSPSEKAVLFSDVAGVCLLMCCGSISVIVRGGNNGSRGWSLGSSGELMQPTGEVAAPSGSRGRFLGGSRVTIKHDPYTQIIMPKLPSDRIIDSSKHPPLEKDIGAILVPDISKVDFTRGRDGAPIELVEYHRDDKSLWQQGYFYRNKAGNAVYHGLWHTYFRNSKKEWETIYVHRAVKCENKWNDEGTPERQSVFKSDEDYQKEWYVYWPSGDLRSIGHFVITRYPTDRQPNATVPVPHGLHVHYYDNGVMRHIGRPNEFGGIQQEELFENGRSVGKAVDDRAGKKVTGRGKLGP